MYKVIICDLQNSRNLKNREEVQNILISLINSCNTKFSPWIISNFKITTGDEWEGLLNYNAPIYTILNYFYDNLPNYIKFYFGIGQGTLSIKNFNLSVSELDGEAFFKARTNLNLSKEKNITFTRFEEDIH